MNQAADVVICGAGIAGVAAAHFLSKAGVKNILLLDERPPLSLTSDHSTECYRNWWPDPEMLALMNRSIDLMEALADESGNVFRMNRRGYFYLTADEKRAADLETSSHRISSLGAGPRSCSLVFIIILSSLPCRRVPRSANRRRFTDGE